MLKHIWFDFAGTLYRETPLFNEAHDKLRYTTYAKVVGESDLQKAEKDFLSLYKQYGTNAAVFRSLGKSSSFWQDTFDELDIETLLRPDPKVAETVKQIHELLPVSVFSNFKKGQILSFLKFLEIPATYFTNILDGDSITIRKPDLEGFHKMVELSGVPASQILYIGDRVSADIKPAKQAGMNTCLVYGQSDEADFNVQDFRELISIINTLE